MATYPRTIYFPVDDRRVIVNIMPGPGARFCAVDADAQDEGALIWGLGDTELAAIADLNETIQNEGH